MRPGHVELRDSGRAAHGTATRAGPVHPDARVDLTVTLNAPKLPAAGAMPAGRMSHTRYVRAHGASASAVRTVETILAGFGLTKTGVSHDRRALRLTGTAAGVEAAFQPGLSLYHHADHGLFRARERTLKVPTALKGLVTGVFGLDQRPVARRHARAAAARSPHLGPPHVERLYNFPAGTGLGQVVAIAEFGAVWADGTTTAPAFLPADLAKYCRAHKRAIPEVRAIPVNLSPMAPARYAALRKAGRALPDILTGETMLDIEIASGLCPEARVDVYYATYDQKGWIDLLDAVAGQRAPPAVLSISWGHPEDSNDWSEAGRREIANRVQTLALLGTTVCVSAGDDGSGDGVGDGEAHVEFPASCPFALSVGGTMRSPDESELETAWWEAPGTRARDGTGGATGGGVSTVFRRPPWQKARIASVDGTGFRGRIVPDVAALAGPPGYGVVLNGSLLGVRGTSAAAPVWAALIARLEAALPKTRRGRFLAPLLYAAAAARGEPVFRDIVSGHNESRPHPGRGYKAGKGFDAVTGWGVPDGRALLKILRG